MTTISFGVNDLPYSHTDNLGTTKKGKRAGTPRASTTGSVAEILEDKYGIFEAFWTAHQDDIVEDLSEGLSGAFESLLQGAPVSRDAFAAGNSQVEERFRRFLSEKEMDRMGVEGVPTKASLMGVSHRFKKKRGPPRPSFIDTGLYESSMVSEVE